MSEVNLGQIRREEDSFRDAVHVAVAPVVAQFAIKPGEHVGFMYPGDLSSVSQYAMPKIGVIDPFREGIINAGEPCWMLLMPNTVTSLRHEWTHPDFPEVEPEAEAKDDRDEEWDGCSNC